MSLHDQVTGRKIANRISPSSVVRHPSHHHSLKLLFAILILSTVLTACAGVQSAVSNVAPAGSVTITDDAGRQVTLKGTPMRIVSLAPSNTEVVFALGLGDRLVGDTEYCDYPPEAKTKPKVGGFADIDLEKVIGLNPDLVLATSLHTTTVVPELQKRGIPVVVVDPQTVDDVLNKFVLVGKMTGTSAVATQLTNQMKTRIDAIAAKTANVKDKPRVFYEIDNTLYTAGPGSFINDMIAKAGGINIAADAKGAYPQLTLEALVLKDPQVILLGDHPFGGTPETVKARPGWANISAVKSGRIIPVTDVNVVSRPGPRTVQGLELLASALYPDLFK